MGASHFATNGSRLPSLRHGKQALVLSLIIDAPTSNPVKPLAGIEGFPDHVIIEPQLVGLTPFKRPAHENLGLRKGRAPRRHVTFQNIFRRQPFEALLVVDMPLAPVADTAQLNEGDKAILPPTLTHSSHRLVMGFNQGFLTIVWRKALAIIGLIPVTGALNSLIEPIRNILMTVLPR